MESTVTAKKTVKKNRTTYVTIHHAIERHNIYPESGDTIPSQKTKAGIWGHDPNSKNKDELGHVPRFLPAYSLYNFDSNSISVNSYPVMAKITEDQQIFENLRATADAVQALFGPNCEVTIHDMANLKKSLVYIKGDVTGRKPGAPATNLLVKLLQQSSDQDGHNHNYKSVTADGRCLKSTTTIIKNSKGKAVAALCINLDTTSYFNAIHTLLPFIHDLETGIYPSKETFANSAEDAVRTLFGQAVDDIGTQPGAMSIDEKTRFIKTMKDNGVFQFKGAVEEVSRLMDVTKCTVYNYLKKTE